MARVVRLDMDDDLSARQRDAMDSAVVYRVRTRTTAAVTYQTQLYPT